MAQSLRSALKALKQENLKRTRTLRMVKQTRVGRTGIGYGSRKEVEEKSGRKSGR
jgi:hypothetical protein